MNEMFVVFVENTDGDIYYDIDSAVEAVRHALANNAKAVKIERRKFNAL